jgi:hypothetical protein
MQEPNIPTTSNTAPQNAIQHNAENFAGVNALITPQIGKRIVKYTLLSDSDLLVLTAFNALSGLSFSMATFFYGNVYLSIQIQSLFATNISSSQQAQIASLLYFSKILMWVFFVFGMVILLFRFGLLRIAKIESLDTTQKKSFWSKIFRK